MNEPGIAGQDDFQQISEEVKIRELITPLRYHAVGIGSVVASGAFDRLRDAYLRATQINHVGTCSLCHGDVTTGEQFLRTDIDKMMPTISHIRCEERAQRRFSLRLSDIKIKYKTREIVRLETVLANIRLALGNLGHTVSADPVLEESHAISEGKEQSGSVKEHPHRNRSGEATEASSSDSPIESREVQPGKEQPFVQEGAGAVGYDIDGYEVMWPFVPMVSESGSGFEARNDFRIDDVLSETYSAPAEHLHKWPPEFRRYYTDKEPIATAPPDCKNDPLGCNTAENETLEKRYGLYAKDKDNGLQDPPLFDLAYNTKAIQSCCE